MTIMGLVHGTIMPSVYEVYICIVHIWIIKYCPRSATMARRRNAPGLAGSKWEVPP